MLFGLACEGVTDQITIENILCGYFDNPDLDEDITQLQPPFDETTQQQKAGESGGWTVLLKHYLCSQRFRDDVLNTRFTVIQVDTDVSERKGFDVVQVGTDNQPLVPEVLIENVIERLVGIINAGDAGFYGRYSERIIFAISVHSLECWLFAHHKKNHVEPKIHSCFNELAAVLPKLNKSYRCYARISQAFRNRQTIQDIAAQDPSFRVFIDSLSHIEIHQSQE